MSFLYYTGQNKSRRRSLSFISHGIINGRRSPSVRGLVWMLMLILALVVSSLLLASLVNGSALGNTVIVALPDDVCV